MGLGVGAGVGVGVGVGVGAGVGEGAGGCDARPPSSSKLVKLESEDKLLADLGRPESPPRPPPPSPSPFPASTSSRRPDPASPPGTRTTQNRRRATPSHFRIPTFLASQSARTHVGQYRVSVDDPAGMLLAHEGAVHGRGAVEVAARREIAGGVEGCVEGCMERGGRGIGCGGRGRRAGCGARVDESGAVVYGAGPAGAFFSRVLDRGPGLTRFLAMVGAGVVWGSVVGAMAVVMLVLALVSGVERDGAGVDMDGGGVSDGEGVEVKHRLQRSFGERKGRMAVQSGALAHILIWHRGLGSSVSGIDGSGGGDG